MKQFTAGSLIDLQSRAPHDSMSYEGRSSYSDATSVLYKYGKEAEPKGKFQLPTLSSTMGTSSFNGSFNGSTDSRDLTNDKSLKLLERSDDESVMTNFANTKAKSMRLVSGSQFRYLNKGNIHNCEQCDMYEKINRKHKETIRSLKLQLARMEENFKDLKFTRSVDNLIMEHKPNNNEPVYKDEHDFNMTKKCESLEEELSKTRKLLAYERSTNDALRLSLEEARNTLQIETEKFQFETEKQNHIRKSNEETIHQYKLTNHDLENTIILLKQQLEKLEKGYRESISRNLSELSNQENNKEIEKLRKEIEKLDQANKNLLTNYNEKTSLLTEAEDKIINLYQDVEGLNTEKSNLSAELTKALNDLKNAQDQIAALKKRTEVLESTIKITIVERDAAKNIVSEKEKLVDEKVKIIEDMDLEIKTLNYRLQDLMRRMANDSENTKKALEKAISSSVRLCVVAPTVNVHIGENKKKSKSQISDAALKQFLDAEIFEKYSFLYKQRADNTAPNGENLEIWLQKMLAQMQVSIENHVNAAMDGSSM